jgi:hypothetical protein
MDFKPRAGPASTHPQLIILTGTGTIHQLSIAILHGSLAPVPCNRHE